MEHRIRVAPLIAKAFAIGHGHGSVGEDGARDVAGNAARYPELVTLRPTRSGVVWGDRNTVGWGNT